MLIKPIFSLMIMVTSLSLISACVARAGWGWENVASKGSSLNGGSSSGDPSLEAASRAVREGKDAEALKLIRQAAATLPRWHPVLLELARLQFAANQPAKSRRTLEQAAKEYPTDPRVYLMFGSLALSEGRYSDARLNGEKALSLLDGTKLDAESIRAVRREAAAALAAAAEAVEDWALARVHLLAWLEIDSSNALARQRLGRALFALGKTDEAYKELTQSTKDEPKLGSAAVPMALMFIQAGNDAKAEEWFVYASRVEPKNPGVRLALARWRLDKGRNAEARLLVEEAAKLDPKSKEVEPLRGLVALQLRELETAERIFEALHRDAPADAGFCSLLTLALVEQDNPEKRSRGLQLAEVNVQTSPKALDALASLARAHARLGHRDEAERLLRVSIARAGGQATPTVAYFLAQVLAEKGQIEEARNLLRQATVTPIAFAYQADARKLLTSLGEENLTQPATPAISQTTVPKP
jgi:tetratricopeptide (TPR) repeat protein